MGALLLILIFAVNFGGRIIFMLTEVDGIYFLADSLSWLVAGIYILRKLEVPQPIERNEITVAYCLLALICNNFYDDCTGNATTFGWNEVVLLVIVFITGLYNIRCKR